MWRIINAVGRGIRSVRPSQCYHQDCTDDRQAYCTDDRQALCYEPHHHLSHHCNGPCQHVLLSTNHQQLPTTSLCPSLQEGTPDKRCASCPSHVWQWSDQPGASIREAWGEERDRSTSQGWHHTYQQQEQEHLYVNAIGWGSAAALTWSLYFDWGQLLSKYKKRRQAQENKDTENRRPIRGLQGTEDAQDKITGRNILSTDISSHSSNPGSFVLPETYCLLHTVWPSKDTKFHTQNIKETFVNYLKNDRKSLLGLLLKKADYYDLKKGVFEDGVIEKRSTNTLLGALKNKIQESTSQVTQINNLTIKKTTVSLEESKDDHKHFSQPPSTASQPLEASAASSSTGRSWSYKNVHSLSINLPDLTDTAPAPSPDKTSPNDSDSGCATDFSLFSPLSLTHGTEEGSPTEKHQWIGSQEETADSAILSQDETASSFGCSSCQEAERQEEVEIEDCFSDTSSEASSEDSSTSNERVSNLYEEVKEGMREIQSLGEKYEQLAMSDAGCSMVDTEPERAVTFFQVGALLGDPHAIYNLALCYHLPRSLPQDLKKARELYESASARGHGWASYNLAVLLSQGLGGPPDQDTAYELLVLAAERGVSQAQEALRQMEEEEDSKEPQPAGKMQPPNPVPSLPSAAPPGSPNSACHWEPWEEGDPVSSTQAVAQIT